MDFVYQFSICSDNTVGPAIPIYFENKERPIVSYDSRNVIFNYYELVADLDIQTNT